MSPRTPLESGEIDVSAFEKREMLRGKVLAHHGNEVDRSKIARRDVEKYVADPPSTSVASPNGVFTVSNATDPTTKSFPMITVFLSQVRGPVQ